MEPIIPSPFDIEGIQRAIQRVIDVAAKAIADIVPDHGRQDRLVPAGPDPDRFGPVEVPAIQGEDELRSRLEAIQGGLSQVMDLSIRPHDVAIDRSVDFQQSVTNNITQNVTGTTAPAAAGQAAAEGTERAGRRAADIAAQEPSLN